MNAFLEDVDALTSWLGKVISWATLALCGAICFELISLYFRGAPTSWFFDVSSFLFGGLFMLAGAYALSRGDHARSEFLYRRWKPATQACVDLLIYAVVYCPVVIALMYAGWHFAWLSYGANERSTFSPFGPAIWPFKFIIPCTGALLTLQGLAEMMRCVLCLRHGQWPERIKDVEDMEKAILHGMRERGDASGASIPGAERG